MRQYISNTKTALAGVLVLTLFFTGCVELEAIRKFAATSAVVGQKFPVLSSDVYGSCTRRYRYRFYRVVNFNADKVLAIDNLTRENNLDNLQTTAPTQAIDAEKDCRRFKEIAPSVVLLNKALVEYMKTMGELAADDLTSYDKELDKLTESVAAGNFFNEAEVNAGKSLVKLVLDATTNFYRRKKLKTAIETRNADVQTLTNALKRFVSQNYILALQQEQLQLDSYYKANIQEHQDQMKYALDLQAITLEEIIRARTSPSPSSAPVRPPDSPLISVSAKAMWDAERQRLAERISAAEAYVKILDNVAQGHQKLYDSRNNVDSKETRQMAMQYAKAIESLIEEFRKAF